MYQQFFNFTTVPFSIAPDPHFIYMSDHHQEGLAHLLYGINQGGGFVALTGEVGTGKTTLCHCLLQQLPDNVEIALVLNPKLSAIELLATICDELHIAYDLNQQSLKVLIDGLNKYLIEAHANGKRTVLVIDEAQNLSLSVLEQVRLLTNLETSTTKLLQIILLGQPELKQILEKPALRQLNQRITARYHLTALSYQDTQKYIKHRLKVSGGNTHIFNRRAIKKIYTLSNGIPRLINIICDRALLGAYVNDTEIVSIKIVNKAAKEIFSSEKGLAPTLFASSVLLLIAMGGLYYFWPKPDQQNTEHVILSGNFKQPKIEQSLAQENVEVKKTIQPVKQNFKSALENDNNSSITTKLPQLAKLWAKNIRQGETCQELEETGLSCLLDKAEWEALIALNRPAILEFPVSKTKKSYALLVGIEQGNPVFMINKKISFPLEQVLKQWNGYYVMLWQPPVANITIVFPNTFSDTVFWIRRHLGNVPATSNTNLFDQALKKEVMTFQRNKGLKADGIVGPRTFIHLKNDNPLDISPKLKRVE